MSAHSSEVNGFTRMKRPTISIIVAMDRNQLIGAGSAIPWHLPRDLKRFRQMTVGKPVVMGRKTYESIPARFRPLSGRQNIVLTRNREYVAPGCSVVHDLESAVLAAGEAEEIMIGGGAFIYQLFLPQTRRIYLTRVDALFDGDTYFPPFDMNDWRIAADEYHAADPANPYSMRFMMLER